MDANRRRSSAPTSTAASGVTAKIRPLAAIPRAGSRPPTTTVAPRTANARAASHPMPDVAPVTTHTFPAIGPAVVTVPPRTRPIRVWRLGDHQAAAVLPDRAH